MRHTSRSLVLVLLALLAVLPAAHAKTVSSHSDRSFKAIPGGVVVVDVSFHDVEVKVEAGDQVKITADIVIEASAAKAQEMLEDYEPRFDVSDTTIRVRSSRSQSFGFGFFGSSRQEGVVKVVLPPGMNLELDTASGDCEVKGDLGAARLVVDTASGELTLEGAVDQLVVDTASGDVEVSLTRPARSISVDTASGEVSLRGDAAELSIDTASGDIFASGLSGGASFDTASGEIRALWDVVPVDARVLADTASGDVRLVFPAGTAVAGRATTTSGDISSDFPGRSLDRGREYRFENGAGGVAVRLDTSSGDIEVLRR